MTGKVFLIGAGPGDPELMTLKAARALGQADVILIDDLVSRGCLAHARAGATVVEVGKRGGCASTPQAFIERLMVLHARQGRTVARLKGGDPFVFGRGGEELEALRAAGMEVEVIPGITAGLATGLPLTHRDVSRGVTFVTGHTKDGGEPDWRALARAGTTLVIYMGVSNLKQICSSLLQAGMPAGTPAGVIENATLATQRQVFSTLDALARDAERMASPAVIVVGGIVRFAEAASSVPDTELRVA